MQWNARPSQQQHQIQRPATENQFLTTSEYELSRSIRSDESGGHAAAGETRDIRRRSAAVPRLELQLTACFGAIDVRCQAMTAIAEQSTGPILNVGQSSEEAQLNTQLYYVLVMLSSGAVRGKCHSADVNEGLESWRNFVTECEPRLQTRTVESLMQVLSYRFSGSVATRLGG
jgi:hypothetical protein